MAAAVVGLGVDGVLVEDVATTTQDGAGLRRLLGADARRGCHHT